MYRTVAPGVVLAVFAVTRDRQAGHQDRDAAVRTGDRCCRWRSCCPPLAEVIVLARTLFPVSGLFTVTENVIVALAPTARFPVQVRFGLANDTLPAVAVASPL